MTATAHSLPSPTARDSDLAALSSKVLARYVGEKHAPTLQIFERGKPKEEVKLPQSVLRLFVDVLTEIAEGNSVSLVPIHSELTTQEAADLLNVSRPYLVQLLEDGKIPFRKVGTKRRVFAKDVSNFKKKTETQRLKVLAKLASQAQDLGMGY